MKPYIQRLQLTLFFLLFAVTSYAINNDTLVSFSTQGGFYDTSFGLALSCPENLVIHYTLNGNTPTIKDAEYSQPLFLDQNLYSNSNIYTVQTCPDSAWFVPESVQKCIIIRAAAFDSKGNRVGTTTTNSYFIKSLDDYPTDLPVVSLCADSTALFGYEEGIYLQGGAHSNCFQHGRDWERLCNIEFYEHDNSGINQLAGLRMHGCISREGKQKGMKIYARKEYGQKRFYYKFFKDNNILSYKNLVFKPMRSGLISDHVCTQIAQSLNFKTPQSRPVVVFLNGEYWGLYFLKERPNERYIADHFGLNKENINIIESWSGIPSCGNNESFINMMKWFLHADLSKTEEYIKAQQLIDIECFIDYYCFQLFTANSDWPNNNMRCWQANDGKWRWIFFDGDCTMSEYPNMLASTLYHKENKDASTLVFTKLFGNEDFRNQFYERFGKLLTHELYPKNTKDYLYDLINDIDDELDSHFNRFGYLYQIEKFDFKTQFMDDFLSYRMVSAAAMVYRLYYHNGWRYTNSKSSSQITFKYKANKHRPVFLLNMARQFKDWKFAKCFFAYERHRTIYNMKTSKLYKSIKTTKLWHKLKGSR